MPCFGFPRYPTSLWKSHFPQGLVEDNLLHSSQLHKLLASTRHAEKIVNLQVGQRGEIRKPGVKSEAMLFPSLLALELSNRRDTQSAPTRTCNLLWGDVVILAGIQGTTRRCGVTARHQQQQAFYRQTLSAGLTRELLPAAGCFLPCPSAHCFSSTIQRPVLVPLVHVSPHPTIHPQHPLPSPSQSSP